MRFLIAALTLNDQGSIITSQYDLSDFSRFTRSNIREIIEFSCKQIVTSADKNKINRTSFDNVYCYTLYQSIWYCLIVTESCSSSIIHDIITKIKNNQDIFGDHKSVDKISKIQKDLDDTRDILVNNIETLLAERGTTLNKLVADSEDLSTISKTFIDNSKKLNKRCCNIS